MEELLCISPIDGRYNAITEDVRNYFSEYNLIKNRIIVEIEWLKKISCIKDIKFELSNNEIKILEKIKNDFNVEEAIKVKEIEKVTKHDVKAVEYYIDTKLEENDLNRIKPFVHFACTSEDINNISNSVMENELIKKVYIPSIEELISLLKDKANQYSDIPMLSHTHGQNATPTTVGKEFAIFKYRIEKILNKIKQESLCGKFSGAVGNFNAHTVSYPGVNWINIAKEFVESFGLEHNLYTTQIESHDNIAIIMSEMKLLNNIVMDFDSDMWMYISRNYFKQKNVAGEVGSSVMPHKINPINFENSMANVRMANGVIDVFLDNIQVSRMQRDLSDSSLQRNVGAVFAYSLIAIKQAIVGLNKLTVNEELLKSELCNTPEVLAEAIQTVLRKNGYSNAYEMLKEMTRGKSITLEDIRDFIEKTEISKEDKELLLDLTPEKYLGLADKIAQSV